ncbi:MAG: patatin-like phospholipase family protein [Gammaproteobacteria bacterium]|nr:patatin-like phospholipase family protein [Gammaproteobacteria bacterium]
MNTRDSGEQVVLVLQGGGALGAYQAGATKALHDRAIDCDWVTGISIGAINAALIAGNPPERRVERLRAFWERVSTGGAEPLFAGELLPRALRNELSAAATTLTGIPGFFSPRMPPAAFMPAGTPGASSFYDTSELRSTLSELVDFELVNHGPVRLSVGAVNVRTGNMTWFDSAERPIGVEHIMASGALPPGFPAVEIDGEPYWDGGLVSNTPLQFVLDERLPDEDLCVFQIDLFSARGVLPDSVWATEARIKDIRYSSRTRLNTDVLRRLHQLRACARRLYQKLPAELRDDPDALALVPDRPAPRITIAHLIYRQRGFEHQSKDYEFSRRSMLEHWQAGHDDVEATLSHPTWQSRHDDLTNVQVYDLTPKPTD